MSSHPAASPEPHHTPSTHGQTSPLERPADALPLATGPHRMALLSFHPAERPDSTDTSNTWPPAHELPTYALVTLWRGDQLLLVRVRKRETWELPGGSVEAGESPRETAVRELWEETGLRVAAGALRLAGHARTALGSPQRVLTGALYTGEVAPEDAHATTAAVPNEEISEVRWWDGAEPLPQLQTVDTYLAALTRPTG